MTEAQLKNTQDIRDYMFAGKAEFTLHSLPTDKHFTYKIIDLVTNYDNSMKFLYYLSGSDNDNDWQYACTIRQLKNSADQHITVKETQKSRGFSAPVMIAFRWFIYMLNKDQISIDLEFMHSGKCSACGRKLTMPESIRTGLGPVCRSRL